MQQCINAFRIWYNTVIRVRKSRIGEKQMSEPTIWYMQLHPGNLKDANR